MILHLGDCLEIMRAMDADSIDAIVTSPPYDDLRDYGNTWDFEASATEMARVLRNGGVIVWIVADQTIEGSESGSSFKQALFFKSIGLKLHDTMIWLKGPGPFQHKNRYISAFEYMFVFSKGKPKSAQLIRDRKNKHYGVRVHGTERQRNGATKPLSTIQKSKLIKEFGSRTNVWEITPDKSNKTGHPAVFPLSLIEDHLRSWCSQGDTILDPFMGSGTTGIAAKNLGFNFTGIELNPEYFEIARARIGGPLGES